MLFVVRNALFSVFGILSCNCMLPASFSSLISHLSPLISHHSLLTSHSRQPDAKSTSFTLLAFYLNRTAIKLDELMNQDKSQPGS